MNNSRRNGLIIVFAAVVLWFIPPPAGLNDAARLASIADEAGIRIWEAQRVLDEASEPDTDETNASETNLHPDIVARTLQARDNFQDQQAGQRAWRLFVIFATTIAIILLDILPVFTAAIGALAISVVTGILKASQAYSGFSESFILLIVVAFTIAIGVAKSGLGARLAWLIISRFGKSSLGLGYSLVLTDVLIAPAFPSNTARSGVLFPIVDSVARGSGSPPNESDRKQLGAYLVMCSITGLALSSGLWLTAMAANPSGADLALKLTGEEFGFARWFMAASVPTLVGVIAMPWFLYVVFPPKLRQTPDAPANAIRKLSEMGSLSRDEKVMASVFVGMVLLWALKTLTGIDNTAVAMLGLFALMVTGVITLDDVRGSNGPATFAWFASLYTLSRHMNQFGFMHWIGEGAGAFVAGYSWQIVYVVLVVAYVLIHYFFVSQTAHMFAVFPIFLAVGVKVGVPAALLGMMLLQATNFFSPLTPQASSSNAIFVGSGYVTTGEVYRHGGLVVLFLTIIFLVVGTPWMLFVM